MVFSGIQLTSIAFLYWTSFSIEEHRTDFALYCKLVIDDLKFFPYRDIFKQFFRVIQYVSVRRFEQKLRRFFISFFFSFNIVKTSIQIIAKKMVANMFLFRNWARLIISFHSVFLFLVCPDLFTNTELYSWKALKRLF